MRRVLTDFLSLSAYLIRVLFMTDCVNQTLAKVRKRFRLKVFFAVGNNRLYQSYAQPSQGWPQNSRCATVASLKSYSCVEYPARRSRSTMPVSVTSSYSTPSLALTPAPPFASFVPFVPFVFPIQNPWRNGSP